MAPNPFKSEMLKRATVAAAYPACLFLAGFLGLFLSFYFERPFVIFTDSPHGWLDYDTHVEQTMRVTEALDGWGKAWAYDVQLHAGFPNGTIFDADNKGWEIWTFALWKAGIPRGMAFNLYILLAHLMVPWVVFASARLFRLDRWASLVAMVLGTMLWYFDAFPHWCWWIGMTAWGMAGYLALLPLALFFRWIEDGRIWQAALCAVFLAAGHLTHPYTFLVLGPAMAALYVRAFRRLDAKRHVGVAAIAAVTLAANAWWIATAIRFWHYITDSGVAFQGTLSYILTDYLGLIGEDPLVSGVVGNRTATRFLCIAAAIIGLAAWRRARDSRFMPFAIALGTLFAITYAGSYFWLTRQIQPYRFVLPAMYMSVIPAAWLIVDAVRSVRAKEIPRPAAILIAILCLVSVPRFARDVLYFVPAMLPDLKPIPERTPVPIADVIGFGDIGFPKHMELRHGPMWEDFRRLEEWVEANDDGQGRWLVEWSYAGEFLAGRTRAQVLGGFHECNMKHASSDLFRWNPEGDLPDADLERYLLDYAVKWVVISHKRPLLEKRKQLLDPYMWIPPHKIYKVKLPVSYFQEGSGKVTASMNRLEVTGSDPAKDVVLRFHWLETLVCDPGCEMRREPLLRDPVGFIRVLTPHPADFAIVNGY